MSAFVGDSDEGVIKNWNTRAPDPRIEALVRAARNIQVSAHLTGPELIDALDEALDSFRGEFDYNTGNEPGKGE